MQCSHQHTSSSPAAPQLPVSGKVDCLDCRLSWVRLPLSTAREMCSGLGVVVLIVCYCLVALLLKYKHIIIGASFLCEIITKGFLLYASTLVPAKILFIITPLQQKPSGVHGPPGQPRCVWTRDHGARQEHVWSVYAHISSGTDPPSQSQQDCLSLVSHYPDVHVQTYVCNNECMHVHVCVPMYVCMYVCITRLDCKIELLASLPKYSNWIL